MALSLGNSSTQQVPYSIPFPAYNSSGLHFLLSFFFIVSPCSLPLTCLHWCIYFSMLQVCMSVTSPHLFTKPLVPTFPTLPPPLLAPPLLLFMSGCGVLPSPPPLDFHGFSLPPVSPPALSSHHICLFLSYSPSHLCVFPSPCPCGSVSLLCPPRSLSLSLTPFLRGLCTTHTG